MMFCFFGLNSEVFGGTLRTGLFQLIISMCRFLICYVQSKYTEKEILYEVKFSSPIIYCRFCFCDLGKASGSDGAIKF